MGFTENYLALQKKKKQQKNTAKTGHSFTDNYLAIQSTVQEEDIAPVLPIYAKKLTEDIAPITKAKTTKEKEKEEEKKDERKWFQKGVFEDGYQLGDVTKTILGTVTDTSENLGSGIIGMGEKVVDAFATVSPYIAKGQFYANGGLQHSAETRQMFDEAIEQSKGEISAFVKKDLYDENKVARAIITNPFQKLTGINAETASVFGEKTDSLMQSAGQLGATIGLQAVGVPWFVTTGVTSFGGEAESALNEGASLSEATLSSAITAGAEILTEKISGGIKFGGKALDDVVTKQIARGVSNKTVRTLAKLGLDMTGEGAEEVLSGVMSAIGQKITYADDQELTELFSSEEALESFIGGAVLGGGMGGINAVKSGKQGVDYASGLTTNEQKVVEHEYQKRVAEAEKTGKQTTKQKSKIYDEVLKDMEKGYISTDTIEEVLGGESYKTYKDTIENEDALSKEYEELGKLTSPTLAEQTRYKELHEQMKGKDTSQRTQLKTKLTDEVMGLVQNDRLAESYNERSRRGQQFEADLTKYDTKQQETIKKAVESGILNNTNRTHEFVDMVAKITADKGVLFDFTNNAKLKESGFAVNGKAVNGFVTKDGISLNIDSAKAMNSVVGHEITHVLEGTELYNALQQTVFEYAKSKGEYDSRHASLTELYEGVDGANVDAELTADLVGDYLFTDSDFIHNLSTNHRNVFQKIYDEIKYLCKVATAGSKEARELEEVKRAFDKAYRESGKAAGGTKYSVSDSNIKDVTTGYASGETYFTMTYEQDGKTVGKLDYGEYDGEPNVKMIEVDPEYRRRGIGKKLLQELQKKYPDAEIDFGMSTPDGTKLLDAVTYTQTDEQVVEGKRKLVAAQAELTEVERRLNELYDLEELTAEQDKEMERLGERWDQLYYTDIRNLQKEYGDKPESRRFVKYSLSDSDGKQLTKEQQEYTTESEVQFSLSKPVEETKDLMALHNLTADKLSKSLELGGLPMPSLAITKADIPHDNFGEITMIFGKDTIDPKTNKKNKIYSADAWTPVFPRVEYETDSKVENAISQRLRGLEGKIDDSFQRDLRRIQYGFEDYLNSQGGEEGLIQYAMDNYGLKAAYLEEQGNHIDKVTKQQEAEKGFNPDAADKYLKIMDILGVSTAEEIGNVNLKDAKDNHGAELETVYPGITKTASRMSRVFMAVKSYLENKDSGPVYNTVTDSDATRKAVDDALDAEGYENWVRNLFAGIVKDSGIYNNKDLFTPSGNRRSFKQTHLPVTLENIVKAMAGQNNGNAKNVSGFNGIKTLRASTAETFKSVKEMHQKKGRLQNLTQEQFEEIHDSLQDRLYKIIETIDNETAKHGEQNPYIRFDSIGETLTEIGESGKFGIADIQRVFQQYSKTVSDDTAMEVKQLLYDVAQMPVNIFEAKPQRVVNFDEAAVFVIPNNADAKLKQELLNRGYSIAEYDPNVEGDRQRVVNQFEEYKFSLSDAGKAPKQYGSYNVYGKDIALETAPAQEMPVAENATTTPAAEMFPDDLAPMAEDENEAQDRLASLDDADAPPEMDAPYSEDSEVTVEDPFEERDWYEVGKRNVKAYMYENPEVKPFFQEEAARLLGELNDTVKGERWYDGQVYYDTNGENGWGGTKRFTSDSIAEMLDSWDMSYADIEKGLNAIIEDNGAENIAAAKKIEFMLNDRLLNGYKDFYSNSRIEANEDYINLLNEKQITEYSKEAFDAFMANADQYAPPVAKYSVDDIAPFEPPVNPTPNQTEADPKREIKGQQVLNQFAPKTANILTEEPKVEKKKSNLWSMVKNNVIDKGAVFETLSLKTGNRELQAKWSAIRRAESRAQRLMEKGNADTQSLKNIVDKVEKSGKTKDFYTYLYHQLNVDRMTLEERYENTPNKAVFGDSVTADISRSAAYTLERANPEFKRWAKEVYNYNSYLRGMMVDNGVISQETADLWAEMYPHYVPIRRVGDEGLNINVPLDTGRTGVNAPIKRATGGNSDILPLFDTMAMRTEQTFKAIAKNRFGVELKNTLGTTIGSDAMGVDEAIDSVATQDSLLQKGENGRSPTFTVFENGKRVTFEITEEMYDAMKPKSDAMAYTNKVLNKANNIRRGLLTEYNPAFMLTNPIKDTQDVLINSQHPLRTYKNYPKAIAELAGKKGRWYQEYMDNGGEMNTYFDGETNTFTKEKTGLAKAIGMPLDAISAANNFIERIPRLAEYIASREMGRSIDVSMLDAARVTTDFSAGGDLTKMMNRNGFTFLNASVQGAAQQVRNIREAKYNGLKGWAQLAGKATLAGLAPLVVNHLLWDDDEEYAELSDYVKQNYYVVAKFGDGKFVRIPKGRTLAVIQDAFEQMENLVTGNDEVDLGAFTELVISNLAPSNPLDNNLIAPIAQAWSNRTWYGEDLVPTRLQDLPAAEQYDESTDAISKWLGEKAGEIGFDLSPYKINYLLDQYSGGLGDTFLPMMTSEAERGDTSLIAPVLDKFTTDSVMKNQNISDFYTLKDELTVKANSMYATDEDVLKSKYMNSINAEMAQLYAEKRKIQNSDMPNAKKYEAVRDIQKQIIDLTEEGMNNYDGISYEDDYREGGEYARVGGRLYKLNDEGEWQKLSDDQVTKYEVTKAAGDSSYATDGENHYRWYIPGEDADEGTEPGWRKVTEKELERQEEVTGGLDITPEEYWSNKDEYSYAYEHPENYAVAKAVGGYDAYKSYSGELYDIKADKDSNGKSISGSRKEKVLDYINNLDADYYTKIILWKSEYTSDDSYNYEIIEYLNSRDDISFEETAAILRKLGFSVTDDGDITW